MLQFKQCLNQASRSSQQQLDQDYHCNLSPSNCVLRDISYLISMKAYVTPIDKVSIEGLQGLVTQRAVCGLRRQRRKLLLHASAMLPFGT